MTENNKQNNQNPTSLESWQEHNTVTVMFSDNLGFKMRHIDVASWLTAQKDNPLMATLQTSMKQGNNPEKAMKDVLTDDKDALGNLANMLNDLLIEVVIEPPLAEQGNDPAESISLMSVLLEHKMLAFSALSGGDQFAQMSQFRSGQASNVVAAPEM